MNKFIVLQTIFAKNFQQESKNTKCFLVAA